MLKRRYFDRNIGKSLAYATIGLLFVNVSIGGTLTHFAAPPVLMVATPWNWNTYFMASTFGWRAAASCLCSTLLLTLIFWKQLNAVEPDTTKPQPIPAWLTILHFMFLASVVAFAHHPDVFFGIFMIFLGLVTATREYQDSLKLREGLLVGFFLAGLGDAGKTTGMVAGSVDQEPANDWRKTVFWRDRIDGYHGQRGADLSRYTGERLCLPELKYALVAGAVSGGGLTVIANAPNPAGAGILQRSRAFGEDGLSPYCLLLGAIPPTSIAICFFWLIA